MSKILRIDHLAILVEDLDASLDFWQEALEMKVSHVEEVPAEEARIAFLPAGGSEVELVQPTSLDSGLRRYLDKRGAGMHHICLEVDDLEDMLARLAARNVQLINETPRLSSDGKKYAFIHPKSSGGVLVELYELPESHQD